MVATNANKKKMTLKDQYGFTGACCLLFVATSTALLLGSPNAYLNGQPSLFHPLLWATMDLERRGKSVGWWRLLVVFTGPIGLAIYLLTEYRKPAVYMIPAMLGVYATVGFVPVLLGDLATSMGWISLA